MFTKKIYQWNAVDVVRSDGEVQRGIVVDKHESHLLVDFDIAGKEPELVPCHNAYLSNADTSRDLKNCDSTVDDDAAILLRLSKDQPWKWYYGKVLLGPNLDGDKSFALVQVEIRTGGEVITECVRSAYIRRAAYSGRPVRKNDFVRAECSVPDGFSYDARSIVPWRERFPRTLPLGIVDNKFHFLQLRYDKDFDANEMASALSDGIPEEDEMDTADDNRSLKSPREYTSNEEVATADVTEDLCINDLPLDILGVVFSLLDGRQQTRMRRVCIAWNCKILSPECSREMIVDLSLYQEGRNHQYILAAWMFHCITKWTKYVTITLSGCKSTAPWDGGAMLILQKIMKFKSPLSALILFNMQLEPKNILSESRTAISEDMQRVCSRVIFKDFTIKYLFTPLQDHLTFRQTWTNSSDEDLRIVFGSVNVGSEKELLDCFELAAADFADSKHHDALERVSKAIVQAHGEHGHPGNVYRQSHIIKVLKDWQTNDLRFGPNTEWKHVQVAHLEADLLTLRHITLSALVCLARRWNLEDSEVDDYPSLYNSHGDYYYYNEDPDYY